MHPEKHRHVGWEIEYDVTQGRRDVLCRPCTLSVFMWQTDIRRWIRDIVWHVGWETLDDMTQCIRDVLCRPCTLSVFVWQTDTDNVDERHSMTWLGRAFEYPVCQLLCDENDMGHVTWRYRVDNATWLICGEAFEYHVCQLLCDENDMGHVTWRYRVDTMSFIALCLCLSCTMSCHENDMWHDVTVSILRWVLFQRCASNGFSLLQCVAACCSVLQRAAVSCSVCCSVCCSVLGCVVVCYSVL